MTRCRPIPHGRRNSRATQPHGAVGQPDPMRHQHRPDGRGKGGGGGAGGRNKSRKSRRLRPLRTDARLDVTGGPVDGMNRPWRPRALSQGTGGNHCRLPARRPKAACRRPTSRPWSAPTRWWHGVPALGVLPLRAEQLLQIDSADFTDALLSRLARRVAELCARRRRWRGHHHGTDTPWSRPIPAPHGPQRQAHRC